MTFTFTPAPCRCNEHSLPERSDGSERSVQGVQFPPPAPFHLVTAFIDKKTKVYLIGSIRKIWRWSKVRRDCLKAAQIHSNISKHSKKIHLNRYRCAICKKLTTEPVADHISPVVPVTWREGEWDWNQYIMNMFTGALQAVCKPCHKNKTKKENKARKEPK